MQLHSEIGRHGHREGALHFNNFSLSYDRVYKIENNTENEKWNTYNKKLTSTSEKKLIPYGIELYYGSAYIIATRDFLRWVTTDPVPINLIDWSRDLYSPDEIIWATLSRIYQKQQKIIQSSNSIIELNYSNILPPPTQNLVWQKNDLWQNLVWQKIDVLSESVQVEPQFSYARTVKWESEVLKKKYPVCQGYYRHGICVFGIGDLGWLLRQNQLFANKFDDHKDDLVLQCLEDWLKMRESEKNEC